MKDMNHFSPPDKIPELIMLSSHGDGWTVYEKDKSELYIALSE